VSDERPWPKLLSEVLAIEPSGDGWFRARLDGFGGITLGCATLAAARTCEGWPLDSLHAYFLRSVPTDAPCGLRVERLRDGRRLAHRRVQISDGGRLAFELLAAFAAPAADRGDRASSTAEFQQAELGATAPGLEVLPTEAEVARAEGWGTGDPSPLEWRWIGTPWRPDPGEPSGYRAWVRPRSALPSDRGLQAAALAFLADYHSHWSVARRLGAHFEPHAYTSLDQSLWVHRDVAWDDWRLLVTESDVSHAGRALTRRALYTRDGRLVASMAQEQLVPGTPGRSAG
jgi:acyl-CoA thioesterase-2